MEEKLFTISDMKAAFIAGELFENNSLNVDMGELSELTEPDFGEWMLDSFSIEVK